MVRFVRVGHRPMWILLIEDVLRIRAFIARGLGADGLTVEERDDGQLGLCRTSVR